MKNSEIYKANVRKSKDDVLHQAGDNNNNDGNEEINQKNGTNDFSNPKYIQSNHQGIPNNSPNLKDDTTEILSQDEIDEIIKEIS